MRRLLLLLLLLPMMPPARAASGPEAAICPFHIVDALRLAEDQLAQLYQSRATPKPMPTGMPPDIFLAALETYLGADQFGRASSPSGLLFYASDTRTVCVVFARATDTYHHYDSYGGAGGHASSRIAVDMVALPQPPAEIAALIDDRARKLAYGSGGSARAPKPRSEFARRQMRGAGRLAAPADPDALLADMARAVLPSRFAAEIEALTSLTVVPALNFGKVPFGALDPDGDGRPLMGRLVVNVESSMRSIFEENIYAWDMKPPRRPLVVGDPDATGDPDWDLPRLPFAAQEAGYVADLWRSTAVAAAQATPQRVAAEIESADYIHIAAHGIASIDQPMDNSFLALTGGRLTARQIQALNLKSLPVVVLSACQSALGSPLDAGIIGVARAFIIAGSAQVIASLWNVDDEATAFVMQRFAELLLETNPANALRRAQLEARRHWPSPHVWAAFIAYGPRIVDQPAPAPEPEE